MERPQKSVCFRGQKILFERTVNTVLLQLVKNVSWSKSSLQIFWRGGWGCFTQRSYCSIFGTAEEEEEKNLVFVYDRSLFMINPNSQKRPLKFYSWWLICHACAEDGYHCLSQHHAECYHGPHLMHSMHLFFKLCHFSRCCRLMFLPIKCECLQHTHLHQQVISGRCLCLTVK